MVQCPVCGEEFDSERGMKIHKSQKHSQEETSKDTKEPKEEPEDSEETQKRKWLWEWRPEVTLITVVSIFSILLITTVFLVSLSNLDLQIRNLQGNQTPVENIYKPKDIDKVLCGKKGVDKMIYCSNSTVCAPQGNKEVKITAIQAPGEGPSTQQRQILQNLTESHPELEVQYICRQPTDSSETCENITWGTPYKEWEQGDYYSIQGLPTLIINCEYRRSGTYASTQPEKEENQLKEIIEAF